MSEVIDRKFEFIAFNPCKGKIYTHKNGILFLAKDLAVPEMLDKYMSRCEELGCGNEHIHSMALAKERILHYQRTVESHVPDTNLTCEIERCIKGAHL